MLSKRDRIEALIRQAYGYSGMTQAWLQSHPKDNSIKFLENDLQCFIKKHELLINEIL